MVFKSYIISNGFTLVELVVTMVVAMVFLTMAVPSFQATIQNNRMTVQTNDFIIALNLARSEAVKRGVSVTVRRAGAKWEDGWIVFSDLDGDGIADTATDACKADEDCILKFHGVLSKDYTLRGNANVAEHITYNPRGMSPGHNGTLIMCDVRGFGEHARAIVISRTGRARSMIASDSKVNVKDCDATPK